MKPIAFTIRTDRSVTLLDSELVTRVAKDREWAALRLLFMRWLAPTPTPKLLDELEFEHVSLLGAQIMEVIKGHAERVNAQTEMLNDAPEGRPH